MRSGGGKDKGSSFERATGAKLSEYLTRGKRTDLFSRNVLSGGQFTVARKKNETKGTPGDLVGIDPLAADFLSVYFVECKHYKTLGIEAFFFDKTGKSFLGGVIKHCRKQALEADRHWLVIAKQNMRPTMLFCESGIGLYLASDAKKPLPLYMFDTVASMSFDLLLSSVSPKNLLLAGKNTFKRL